MTDLRAAVDRTIADAQMHRFIGAPTRRIADALLPIIAAHEAEVVGSVLDRIDALHQPTKVYIDACSGWDEGRGEACDRPHIEYRDGTECHFGGPYREVCQTCTREAPDDGWDSDEPEPHPCPTRRLTAEIRGEMSHG